MVHLLDEQRLGRLLLGHFQRFARLPAGHDVAGWWGRWDRAGGGAVMTQAIHEIDLMLHLFGPATSVRAEIATLGLADRERGLGDGGRALRERRDGDARP